VRVVLVGAAGASDAGLDGLADAFADGELVRYDGGALDGDALVVVGAAAGPELYGALRAFAGGGRPVLGVGGGFAALCAAELLPGRLESRPPSAGAPTHARVEGRATPFTWAIPAGRVVPLGAAAAVHYVAPDAAALEAAGRVLLRYCDVAGGLAGDSEVAGACDAGGNVVGLLPAEGLGRQIVASLRLSAGRR
jgi:phosphoribosylformylglycinamidine (FGAM) synthase-like amidotransferase family enzyme